MTVWHVLNIVGPLVLMVGVGFVIDHLSKPEVPIEESQE